MASWTELATELGPPPTAAAARAFEMARPDVQAWIVEQIAEGHHPPLEWSTIRTRVGDLVATFRVTSQPVRLGSAADSVVPIVSARTAQAIAGHLDAVVVTPKIFDVMARQGTIVDYVNDTPGDVADISRAQMVANSRRFDELVAAQSAAAAPFVWGKQWPNYVWYNDPVAAGLTGGANTSINYGAPVEGVTTPYRSQTYSDLWVWQPPGGRGELWHDFDHVDISQKGPYLVHRDVELTRVDDLDQAHDSWTEDIAAVLADPEMYKLAANHGPIHSAWIPVPDGGDPPRPPPGNGGPSPSPPGQTPAGHKPKLSLSPVGWTVLLVAGTAMAWWWYDSTRQ